jgi:hypothetical protein
MAAPHTHTSAVTETTPQTLKSGQRGRTDWEDDPYIMASAQCQCRFPQQVPAVIFPSAQPVWPHRKPKHCAEKRMRVLKGGSEGGASRESGASPPQAG